MGANTSDADKLQGLGRSRRRGSLLLIKQSPNAAGGVVWGDFYFDQAAVGGVTGTAATSQAQTIAATGTASPAPVSGVGATSQAQTISGNGTAAPQLVIGVASAAQAQTATGNGTFAPQDVSGVITTSQAQSVSATGVYTLPAVTGEASTAQAQTIAGNGSFVSPVTPSNTNAGRGSHEHYGLVIDARIEQRKALEVIAKVAIKQVEKPRSESHRKQQLTHEIAKADLAFNAFYVDLLANARSQVLTEQIRAEMNNQRLDAIYLQQLITKALAKKVDDDDIEAITAMMLLQ